MSQQPNVDIRPARIEDAGAIASCVADAYRHYIPRIGRPPRPMVENYAEVIEQRQVSVADSGGKVVGVLVLGETEEGFLLDNIAVHPSWRKKGIGKALLGFAESQARRQGFTSIYLYTHEKMTENRALYRRVPSGFFNCCRKRRFQRRLAVVETNLLVRENLRDAREYKSRFA